MRNIENGDTANTKHGPKWAAWIIASVIILVIGFGSAEIYTLYQGTIEGGVGAAQLQNDELTAGTARAIAASDIPGTIQTWTMIIGLSLLAIPGVKQLRASR